ncbi:hypothetical protein [Leisingera sp.]|uniref:hypothetical protein n=1 Tax=Leisingera sp. TaxID=1879318 RepID=UPI002B2743D2|nr:hypothetical protein [Leisingera sp.]
MNKPTGTLQNQFRIVGTSVIREDVIEKVTGEGIYVSDLMPAGMLYGKVKRADVAHARIRHIDVSKALAYPGVKAVLTDEDVPRVLHYGSPHPRSVSCTKDQYILDNKVRFWGEGVAAVAAVSEVIAEEALEQIEIEYEELPAVFTPEETIKPGAPAIQDVGPGGNLVLDPVKVERGDVEKGFAEADFILEGEFAGGRPVRLRITSATTWPG